MENAFVFKNVLCYNPFQELEKAKAIAKLQELPPVYTGKWASANDEEVEEELSKGTPYTYRFRVPKEGSLKINDLIRGEVSSVLEFPGLDLVLENYKTLFFNS